MVLAATMWSPAQGVFEQRVAALEGGVAGLAVASGAAAVTLSLIHIWLLTTQHQDNIFYRNNTYDFVLAVFHQQIFAEVLFLDCLLYTSTH